MRNEYATFQLEEEMTVFKIVRARTMLLYVASQARPTLNYDLLVGTFGGDLDLPGLAQRGYVLEVTYSR